MNSTLNTVRRRLAICTLVALFTTGLYSTEAFAQVTQYEQVRKEMQDRLEPVQSDGSRKLSKQFRRWEWFWQSRLNEDGTFPTTQQYMQAMKSVESRKTDYDVQATPTWKELGPTAPNMPTALPGWNGIGRASVVETFKNSLDKLLLGSAQGGMWLSTNAGTGWTAVNIPGFPIFSVADIVAAPSNENIIYVATGDPNATVPSEVSGYPSFSYGILKSTDGGATWRQTGLTITPDANNLVPKLWVDPINPDVVVATTYIGIMKSTDGGATWKTKSTALAFRDIIQHPVNASILYASTFALNGGARFYRSTNAGEDWELVTTLSSASRIKIAVTPAQPNMVMFVAAASAGGGLEGVYKSDNVGVNFNKLPTTRNLLGWSGNGTDWNAGGQGWYDLSMEISPVSANMVVVGGINIWRSSNEGNTWVLSAHWTGQSAPWVHADIHMTKYHKTRNILYAVSDGGIARSTDNGVQWRDISQGLKIQQYYGIATSNINTGLTMAGAQDNGTALTTNGSNYSHVLDGDGMACAIDKINPQSVYGSQYNGRFYRSLNQGNSFSQMSSEQQRGESASWVAPIACDPKTTGVVYIGYTQLYKSTNNGTNWTKLGALPTNQTTRSIAIAPSDPRYIYVGYSNSVYVSSNGGTSFSPVPGIGGFVTDIEVHPTNPKLIWVTFGGFSSSQKILEINDGVAKNISGFGIPNVPCNTVAYQPGALNRLFIGTDVGVFFKDQASTTWIPYGKDMPATVISDINFIPTNLKLRVSTYGRGIWEVDALQCVATKPNVTVTGSNPTCFGDSIILEAPAGYESYAWNNGASGRAIVIKDVGQSGDYTVTVQDNNGCNASSTVVNVTMQRAPVKPVVSVKSDTLRSSAIGGITIFQWYIMQGAIRVPIPEATSRDYIAKLSGQYVVRIENADGCQSYSEMYNVVVDPTSVDQDEQQQMVSISPNPFSKTLSVAFFAANETTISVVDMQGREVLVANVEAGTTSHTLDMNSVPLGVYVVRVKCDNSVFTRMAVKQ